MWYCRLQCILRTGSSDLDFSFKGFNFCMHSSSQKQPECYNLISCLQILCVDTGFEVDFFFFHYSACIFKASNVTEAIAIIIVFLRRLMLAVKSIFPQ